MEIERRFLVKDNKKVEELKEKYEKNKKTIIQDYIYSDIFTAIRKRKIEKNGDIRYIYTIKTGRKGYAVNEIENEITKEQYDLLDVDETRITIEKDRYVIPYIDNLNIELDVFHGKYEGYVFAEIEFESEKNAKEIKVPDWFDIEIGDRISNDMMSKKFIDIATL